MPLTFLFQSVFGQVNPQHSVARLWNEALLDAIRNDFARPTVHARNLFHTSIAMYDCWAIFDETATPFLLGKTVRGFSVPFDGMPIPEDIEKAREEAMSYAAYRLLRYRFGSIGIAPGKNITLPSFDQLMANLGYNILITSEDYSSGSAAALGNYLGNSLIAFGLQDGANEQHDYRNQYYEPVNPSMRPNVEGSQGCEDPNRWQPLQFITFIDQSGLITGDRTPAFLSPEWGQVVPFSLRQWDRTVNYRSGNEYWVYHDPGDPAYLQGNGGKSSAEYQWGNSLVAIWSSHLDPDDSVMWDISPASIGNITEYPTSIEGLRDFYDLLNGGDPSRGYALNPKTGQPYPPQIVPRGDYARVLAEFWADGPDSETPPGHWFTILNYVNDHPEIEKKFKGEGELLPDLEWDVKAYFVLAGAMHDAAITAWSIKGWYDYIRPISAIRYMAEQGQSTDMNRSNFAPNGIPLQPGLIQVVAPGDPLSGDNSENVGKIKLYAWKGTNAVDVAESDVAGVGWILAEKWVPYQRPTFVTPPFAGYVSGHSTFSRAAAEVMTLLTGDEYFPGGVGEFEARKNEFLVFEDGPSMDVTLQWATYRDASDQTSLSRIWGGIHPPVDDMPGRLIGIEVGIDAFAFAERYFEGDIVTAISETKSYSSQLSIFPNPVNTEFLTIKFGENSFGKLKVKLMSLDGKKVLDNDISSAGTIRIDVSSISPGLYVLSVINSGESISQRVVIE